MLAGSLHDHSADSDGDAPSDVIAAYVRAHARELGLDFLSFTEHSDLFPGSRGGPDPWARSGSVCERFSGDGLAFLRGFEWTNDQQNHLDVLGSSGWIRGSGDERRLPPVGLQRPAGQPDSRSERPDLWATLRTRDGAWMGSTVQADPGEWLRLVVDAGTSTSRISSVTLVQDRPDDGRVARHSLGDNAFPRTKTDQHYAACVEQHRRFVTSGGRATFKGRRDLPPPDAVAATVPWEAGARTVRLRRQVPTTASPRADGAHWVYAVVTREDGARVTTAPVFVRS